MVEVDASVDLDLMIRRAVRDEMNRDKKPYSERIMIGFQGQVALVGGVQTARFRVYDVPDGMTFLLYKFITWDDAHNPSTGSVYTNAAAWCGIFHGIDSPATIADFWPKAEASTGQVLPFSWEYNDKNAPEFRQNDNVFFAGYGLESGHNISLLGWGDLISLKGRPGAAIRELVPYDQRSSRMKRGKRFPAMR